MSFQAYLDTIEKKTGKTPRQLLDEAKARTAYDRISAEHAALYQRPMTEQYEYAKTHRLTEEPLKSVQTAAQTLIAIAERKPG